MINYYNVRKGNNYKVFLILVSVMFLVSGFRGAMAASESHPDPINPIKGKTLPHLDHSAYFKKPIESPQSVTKACLHCHENSSKEIMKPPHWTWISGDVVRNGKLVRLGKKNLINNFCISVVGNWSSYVTCHAGYGWSDKKFDFSNSENIDCLVCHDGSGTYSKEKDGLPKPNTDLAAVAGSVRRPNRENCGVCHFNGDGGMGFFYGLHVNS